MFHGLTKGLTFLQNAILLTQSSFYATWPAVGLYHRGLCHVLSFSPWRFSKSCSQPGLCLNKVLAPEGTHTAASVCPLLDSTPQPYSQPQLIIGVKSQHSDHRNNTSLWHSGMLKAGFLNLFMSLICVWRLIQHLQLRLTQGSPFLLNHIELRALCVHLINKSSKKCCLISLMKFESLIYPVVITQVHFLFYGFHVAGGSCYDLISLAQTWGSVCQH